MDEDSRASFTYHWTRFGFLFADMFTAIAMLFLIANTAGFTNVPLPTPIVASATMSTCSIDHRPDVDVILAVPSDRVFRQVVSWKTPQAIQLATSFDAEVRSALASHATRTAGLAQIYGGSFNGAADVADGLALSNSVIGAVAPLSDDQFVFSTQRTLFQAFWDGDLQSNQVRLVIFFYQATDLSQC